MSRIITKNATRDDRRWMEIFSNYQAIEAITDARIRVIADNYRFDLNVAEMDHSEHRVRVLREEALKAGVPKGYADYYADKALWAIGCKSKASFAMAAAV